MYWKRASAKAAAWYYNPPGMEREDLVALIRKRPGMFIGDPDPHRLLWELVANCVDIELTGRALNIDVELHADGSASVQDDGPGIALSLEQLMVEGHTTPTADGHAPHVHLTLHGAGVVVVSALSQHVEVRTRQGDVMVRQAFSRGVVVSELEQEPEPPRFGTRIQFWPDPEIFGACRWDLGAIQRRLHELVALRSQLACRLVVAPQSFPASLDVTSFLPTDAGDRALHEHPFHCELTLGHATARIALSWYPRQTWSRKKLRSFCNLIETHGGKHLQGFERGIGRALVTAAPNRFLAASKQAYEHVAACMIAVVAVEILDPHWSSPTKDRPINPELAEVVEAAIMAELPAWFERHPDVLEALLA
jgi:DNA gyrase subunit B